MTSATQKPVVTVFGVKTGIDSPAPYKTAGSLDLGTPLPPFSLTPSRIQPRFAAVDVESSYVAMFQLILLSAGVFVLVWVAWNLHLGLRRYGPKLDFPVVGSPADMDYRAAIREGYKKVLETRPPCVM